MPGEQNDQNVTYDQLASEMALLPSDHMARHVPSLLKTVNGAGKAHGEVVRIALRKHNLLPTVFVSLLKEAELGFIHLHKQVKHYQLSKRYQAYSGFEAELGRLGQLLAYCRQVRELADGQKLPIGSSLAEYSKLYYLSTIFMVYATERQFESTAFDIEQHYNDFFKNVQMLNQQCQKSLAELSIQDAVELSQALHDLMLSYALLLKKTGFQYQAIFADKGQVIKPTMDAAFTKAISVLRWKGVFESLKKDFLTPILCKKEQIRLLESSFFVRPLAAGTGQQSPDTVASGQATEPFSSSDSESSVELEDEPLSPKKPTDHVKRRVATMGALS